MRPGDEVVVFTGTIAIDESTPPANRNQAYLAKYREAISDIRDDSGQLRPGIFGPAAVPPPPRPGIAARIEDPEGWLTGFFI